MFLFPLICLSMFLWYIVDNFWIKIRCYSCKIQQTFYNNSAFVIIGASRSSDQVTFYLNIEENNNIKQNNYYGNVNSNSPLHLWHGGDAFGIQLSVWRRKLMELRTLQFPTINQIRSSISFSCQFEICIPALASPANPKYVS